MQRLRQVHECLPGRGDDPVIVTCGDDDDNGWAESQDLPSTMVPLTRTRARAMDVVVFNVLMNVQL